MFGKNRLSVGAGSRSHMYGRPSPKRRRLGAMARPLSVLLAFIGLLCAVAAVLRLTELYMLLNLRSVTRAELLASDRRLESLADLYLLALVPTGVLFLRWFHRAYGNIHPTARRWGTKWAIGGWFAPVASFVVPFQIAQDIWRWSETHPAPGAPTRRPAAGFLRGWWLLWLGGGAASWVGAIIRGGGTVGWSSSRAPSS